MRMEVGLHVLLRVLLRLLVVDGTYLVHQYRLLQVYLDVLYGVCEHHGGPPTLLGHA